ncbi:haloacid dehalogenase superfamily protein NDAI_0K01820 [Naumovozyma dairenensis CBS 421]|uniref:Uncharacterized protein n=1 Tax=Naumovozyma dairenensis (strain ATCC 10597 / BCRC 20456 / CBS 421 / NBRC 0211 / NRRL Y-12639) TaxID=1071378 RepID=G0WHW2_NAUDC|nr:hypothetical protein NDAI_0K01820 [Naumovozyma dairenensis CBS 421]CCD27373.1 hypothetical protein NDAI_0K01820 [Naumovozyma dairenensis CBS 421]
MDGLLLNTEDIYTISLNEILAKYGKGPLTWDVKIRLQGLPGPEAGKRVIEHYGLPITVEEYEKMSVEIQTSLWSSCAFLPGALELIKYLHLKKIPIALCTSSNKTKYHGKTNHLREGFDLFDAIVTISDPRIPKGRGKPHPDIWQLGLKLLNEKYNTNITPEECLVFEDGIPGVQSGKAFGAHVIWVPHPEAFDILGDVDAVLEGRGELLTSLDKLDKAKFGL